MATIDPSFARPARHELRAARESARAHGYDASAFRFTTYQPRNPPWAASAGLPDDLVMVAMTLPGVRPRMYRAARGNWIHEFEHDLMATLFPRAAMSLAA